MNLKLKYKARCHVDQKPIEGIARSTTKGFICSQHYEMGKLEPDIKTKPLPKTLIEKIRQEPLQPLKGEITRE